MSLPESISNYVHLIKRVHGDNFTLRYFAEDPDASIVRSTMFLTPFVYQFFIYNSLYQVDWPASIQTGALQYHPTRDEEQSQAAFEEFLQNASSSIPDALNRAFADIEVLNIAGSWTMIVPDPLITEEQGTKFLNDLRAFQRNLRGLRRAHHPAQVSEVFPYIRELRGFIYRVRCNIFHGRKSLSEVGEPSQNERIKVYYLFLNGLVTLFFLVVQAYAPPNSSLEPTRPASG
jgi:hypothetical protein